MLKVYYSIHCCEKFIYDLDEKIKSQIEYSQIDNDFLEKSYSKELESGTIIPIKTSINRNSSSKRVLVIEPHPDDGVYSVGGTLLNLANSGYQIVSLCLFSNGGNSEIRKKENNLVYNDIFMSYCIFAPFYDVIYRNGQNSMSQKSELSNFLSIRRIIEESISNIKPEIIIGPSGIGLHPDHVITNTALLSICKPNNCYSLWLYEDFPYCNENRYKYIKALVDIRSKFKITSLYHDITNTLYDKVSLQMVYLSQHSFQRKELYNILFELGNAVQLEGQFNNVNVINGHLYERVWCIEDK